MDKKYRIEVRDGITIVRFHAMPGVDDLLRAIDDAFEADETGRRLWVLEKGMDLSSDAMRTVAQYANAKWDTTSKSAVVAPQDLTFGLARIHEAYRDRARHENRVFRDEAEAVAWLEEPFTE